MLLSGNWKLRFGLLPIAHRCTTTADWLTSLRISDATGASEEARAGSSIAAATNNLQAAAFATNSGKRLLNAGDVDGAIAQFRSAIKMAYNYAPAHYQLAQALKQQGDTQQADQEFHRASELKANSR
jgi:Flp pilus assembly protein TadD